MIVSKNWRIKDGYPVHDGDCHIFSYDICTCGLLNHLLWKLELVPPGRMDEFHKEIGKHEAALDKILKEKKC